MARAMTHAILSVHKIEMCSNKILFSSILCKWNTQCISISRFRTRGFAKWERSWGGRCENTRIGSRFMKLTRIFVAFSRYLWLNQTTVTSFLFLLRGNEKMCVCGSSSSNITRHWSPSVQQYHMSGENKLFFIAFDDNAFSFFSLWMFVLAMHVKNSWKWLDHINGNSVDVTKWIFRNH